jgi:hypothetical protein
MKKALKRHGSPEAITTDGLRSYKAALSELGCEQKQEIGRWANNRVENSHLSFRRRERAMLRFRRMSCLRKFASLHANVHNQLAAPPFGPTQNATSSTERPTRPAARPHWRSGRTSWREASLGRGVLGLSQTSCDWTDSTANHYGQPPYEIAPSLADRADRGQKILRAVSFSAQSLVLRNLYL